MGRANTERGETLEAAKIEGISPDMLWTFCVVLVGLMALTVLGYKVVEIIRKEHERRQARNSMQGQDITDRIADKVKERLMPEIDEKFDEVNQKFDAINERFRGVDQKLANDKETIELHTRQLNANEDRVRKLEEGNKALCHGIFALLSHNVDGNSIENLKKTQKAMKNYLIDGTYKEGDWQ